jgi:hypothetical protein
MTATLPRSATDNRINLLGVAAFFAGIWYCRGQDLRGVDASLICVGAYAALILALEVIFLRTPWRDTVGLDFRKRENVPGRIFTKLIGVYGSFGFVAFLYWLFPEYHGSYYNRYWDALTLLGPYVLILAIPYVIFLDERMKEPRDSYYWYGRLLLGRWKGHAQEGASWRMIVQHLLGWVIKGFFLPLMFIAIIGNINNMLGDDWNRPLEGFMPFYNFSVNILFTLDLLAAVAGYSLSLRLFDTHIRSSEPTLMGWVICIVCYQPFLSIVMTLYLTYTSNSWMNWLRDYPSLQVLWGSLALILLVGYTYASINFGCRFSNITHRGVLTGGMYRLTKHPAYICKNTFWWMLHIPFVPTAGLFEALRFCLLLAGINGVYFWRARTEERHMSHDPAYVQYAMAMNEKSLFAPLARRIPFLAYRPPEGWERQRAPYMGLK